MHRVSLESRAGYAAKLTLLFGDEMKLDFLKPGIRFQDGDVEIRVFELLTSPTEEAKAWARARVIVGPLPTMEEARAEGHRIADALLSFAVTQKISISFEESSEGEVVVVVECQSALGMEGRAEMRSVWSVDGPTFTTLLAEHRQRLSAPLANSDRTSLGFYSSAEMEVSIEARFILLITALESFCVQQTHSDDVKKALAKAKRCLVAALGTDHPQVPSLSGQVKKLIRESVAQSIKRTLRPMLTNEQLEFVIKAYGYRSKLLHEGAPIPNIHQVNSCLRDLLRLVYSKRFGWELRYPVHLQLPPLK